MANQKSTLSKAKSKKTKFSARKRSAEPRARAKKRPTSKSTPAPVNPPNHLHERLARPLEFLGAQARRVSALRPARTSKVRPTAEELQRLHESRNRLVRRVFHYQHDGDPKWQVRAHRRLMAGDYLPQWESPAAPGREKSLVGVGVGAQHKNGRPTGRLALKLFLAGDEGKHHDNARFLTRDLNVPFDSIPTGPFFMLTQAGNIPPPGPAFQLVPGPGDSLGTSNAPALAGTLGCKVRLAGGRICVLSNAHVLDSGRDFNNAPLVAVQPGLLDDPQQFQLGNVVDVQYPDAQAGQNIDAAIAEISGRQVRGDFDGLIASVTGFPLALLLNRTVVKIGRTTRQRLGEVLSTDAIVQVDYPGQPSVPLRDQILIQGEHGGQEAFSEPGDSGSVVYEPSGRPVQPVGLLFADNRGSGPTGYYSVCCPWESVKSRFKIVEVLV